jgi:hypothetical protein
MPQVLGLKHFLLGCRGSVCAELLYWAAPAGSDLQTSVNDASERAIVAYAGLIKLSSVLLIANKQLAVS